MELKVKNLRKCFGEKVVLDNFDISFKSGKITCIMGSSGCGKTTLLNILLGLCKFDSGEIYGVQDKKFSVVFQENRLCQNFTVLDNIKLICKKDISDEEIKKDFHQVGLEGIEDKKVRELSGGMQRRVAIVRAIIAESDVIIMDEPFKGLDEATREKVISYILLNKKNRTMIMTTHNKAEVELLKATLINV